MFCSCLHTALDDTGGVPYEILLPVLERYSKVMYFVVLVASYSAALFVLKHYIFPYVSTFCILVPAGEPM